VCVLGVQYECTVRCMCVCALAVCVQYECKKLEEDVSRQITENRSLYSQLLIAALLTPPLNLSTAAVHVENAVT